MMAIYDKEPSWIGVAVKVIAYTIMWVMLILAAVLILNSCGGDDRECTHWEYVPYRQADGSDIWYWTCGDTIKIPRARPMETIDIIGGGQ